MPSLVEAGEAFFNSLMKKADERRTVDESGFAE
jgi:hypothetical protein